jgi:rhomboid family GlyGly-CTERM serine protease
MRQPCPREPLGTLGEIRELMLKLDRPELWALIGAALIVLLQALPAGEALEYRRALLAAEPWRLLSGHLVHLNWTHALVNAAAWVVLARLFAPELDARRQALCMLLAALFVSAALALVCPEIAWYRGASGVLHALYFAGATAMLRAALSAPRRALPLAFAAALVAGGWIKVALEIPRGALTPYADWLGAPTVPQAHLAGAVIATLLVSLFSRRRRPGALNR